MEEHQPITESRAYYDSIVELNGRSFDIINYFSLPCHNDSQRRFVELYITEPDFEYYHLNHETESGDWYLSWTQVANSYQVVQASSRLYEVRAERHDGTRLLRELRFDEHVVVLSALCAIDDCLRQGGWKANNLPG